jgi:hypothetical protein
MAMNRSAFIATLVITVSLNNLIHAQADSLSVNDITLDFLKKK